MTRFSGFLLLAAAALVPSAAQGQAFGASLGKAVSEADLATIGPIVQDSLRDGKAGSVRPWKSTNGDTGNVRLLSGGAAAGDKCGRVRISSIKKDVENRGYIFKYCLDPQGVWRVAG